MKFPLPFILMAVSLSLCAYLLMDTIMGQQASEDRKVQRRLRGLFVFGSRNISRTTTMSSIVTLNQILKQSKFLNKLDELLSLTTLNISVTAFILLDMVLAGIAALAVKIFYGSFELAVAAWLGALLLPFILLLVNKRLYVVKFVSNLVDALIMMRNAFKAGQGIEAALKVVAREGPAPVAQEFDRVVREIELGSHLIEALSGLYRRIKTQDTRLFMMAVLIQLEIGGNIGELFDKIAITIRERLALRREIKALTAQARASGIVLIALPFILMVVLNILKPGYFNPLLQDEGGRKMIALASLSLCVGAAIISKLTQGVRIT